MNYRTTGATRGDPSELRPKHEVCESKTEKGERDGANICLEATRSQGNIQQCTETAGMRRRIGRRKTKMKKRRERVYLDKNEG